MLLVQKYFKDLTQPQIYNYSKLYKIYLKWNTKVNLISRKDFESFYLKHVLHSLAIAKFVKFKKGTKVLDLGTGGGFPALPLAIMFPEVEFLAVDSINKKILALQDIIKELGLENITAKTSRVEDIDDEFDFVVTRAVASFDKLIRWTKGKYHYINFNSIDNGLIALKGGDLKEEIKESKRSVKLKPISDYYSEEYFYLKYVSYISMSKK